ncbi:MAG: DUF402 domain-containing protein [Sulfolobaceae archaeon]|nr:DUF402 domain-containing protein [Sulfolobaceae archaeon]
MVKVRIRGIFSTALTSILSKYFTIVQQSLEIAERFSSEQIFEDSDVTIKDNDDKSYLIVLGSIDISDKLREIFKTSVIWNSPVKIYSVIEVKDCEYNGYKVEPCLEEGTVIKAPFEDKVIRIDVPKAVSKYAFLWRSEKGAGRTFFSEHIRDYETRTKLLSASLPFNRKGYNVKWRSNAKFLDFSQLKDELEKLMMKYENRDFKDQGEYFTIVIPSMEDKLALDEERRKVIFTTRFHHMLKATYGKEVDVTEEQKVECPKGLINDLLMNKIETIEHVKVDGEIIHLKGGEMIDSKITDDCNYYLRLKRVFHTRGEYDGLNVEKEPEDYDIFWLSSKDWYSVHHYFSKDGELKGIYINISTPAELFKGKIRYLDLEVDVAITPNSEAKVLDKDKLEEKRQLMGQELYKRAQIALEEVFNKRLEEIIRGNLYK